MSDDAIGMPTTQNSNDHRYPSEGPTTEAVRFCSIEQMQEASEAVGWTINYHQMQAGKLEATTYSAECAGISLMDESVTRRIEVVGEPPPDAMTIMVPAPETQLWLNGHATSEDGILLLQPGTDMHFMSSEGARVISMHIPIAQLSDTCEATSQRLTETGRGRVFFVTSTPKNIQSLHHLMHATIHRPTTKLYCEQRAEDLRTMLTAIVHNDPGQPGIPRSISTLESLRTLRRAREYIEANLNEPISVGGVATHSSASVSKLERTFRRELQMSPTQYILSRRLSAAHLRLKRSDSVNEKIADIALQTGFNHLGRFSGAYRKQFGELPRETLRGSG